VKKQKRVSFINSLSSILIPSIYILNKNKKAGKLELTLGEGQKLELVLNTDFYLSWHGLW
jgi:hypothetical protein